MRQGQQNHRRGRGRGSRKGHNPHARAFESNGPDVKIRGTASHVAEKYMALARDATSSGDLVMAENYLQHAEHYNRIIMAAQAQMRAEDPNGSMPNVRPSRFDQQGDGTGEGGDDWGDDDMDGADQQQQTGDAYPPEQPQPQSQPRFPEQQQHQRYQEQPRMNDLPPFIERSVFGGQNQPGPDQQQPRSYEPRQPRHGQDGRPEHRDRGDGGRSEGRGDGRGPRRRGRYDNGGGRPRQHNQDRQPVQDTAASDVNGAAFVEPARRDNPEPKDGD